MISSYLKTQKLFSANHPTTTLVARIVVKNDLVKDFDYDNKDSAVVKYFTTTPTRFCMFRDTTTDAHLTQYVFLLEYAKPATASFVSSALNRNTTSKKELYKDNGTGTKEIVHLKAGGFDQALGRLRARDTLVEVFKHNVLNKDDIVEESDVEEETDTPALDKEPQFQELSRGQTPYYYKLIADQHSIPFHDYRRVFTAMTESKLCFADAMERSGDDAKRCFEYVSQFVCPDTPEKAPVSAEKEQNTDSDDSGRVDIGADSDSDVKRVIDEKRQADLERINRLAQSVSDSESE